MNRKAFFDAVRRNPFGGRLNPGQVNGLNFILDVWEEFYKTQTPITQFANVLGQAFHESAHTMQPVHEYGNHAYFTRMYDINGARPAKARELGNINPGDGAKFAGMGYIQSTGRANAKRNTKKLHEKGLALGIDFEKTPELMMRPDLAAHIMFLGMEEGWFTGMTLDKAIDENIDGDEHGDYLRARRIVNGTDRAELIAQHSDAFLKALQGAEA